MCQILFFLIDGIGDVGPSTPLEMADTPTLDHVAKCGLNGLMDAVEPGLACGTDTAHLSIFGYDPRTHYRGRGAFESLGSGISMNTGDVAFKCNFAVWDKDSNKVVSRRADRSFEKEGPILCEALDSLPIPGFPNHSVAVKYATEHRCGVRLRGPHLTDTITGTDPLVDDRFLIKSEAIDANDMDGVLTANLLNAVSDAFHDLLVKHPLNAERIEQGKPPANIVLLRGPGVLLDVPTFESKHGLRPFVIAPTAIVKGIAISLGMNVIDVHGASGDYSTNLQAKAEASISAISSGEYDFGFVHVKAVDDTGHDGRPDLKRKWIEECDKMVKTAIDGIMAKLDEVIIVITADHSTPVWKKDHSCEPVPFSVAKLSADVSRQWSGDDVSEFSETSVGVLGRFLGSGVIPMLCRMAK